MKPVFHCYFTAFIDVFDIKIILHFSNDIAFNLSELRLGIMQ